MAMHDSVHTAMHEDSALSAIDSEILHGSRLAGATLTSQLQQGSVQSNEERGEEQRVPLHHFPAKFPRVVNKYIGLVEGRFDARVLGKRRTTSVLPLVIILGN